MSMTRRRAGFTLIEVVVVLAIVAVLLALMLPAVQRVREAANQAVCASRLSQLALAAHAFHADFDRLPPGYLGPHLPTETAYMDFTEEKKLEGQWVGHLPMLLPYLESRDLYLALAETVDFELERVSATPWWRGRDGSYPNRSAYQAARQVQTKFLCPSTRSYKVPIGERRTGGGTIVGIHVFHSSRHGRNTLTYLDGYENAPEYHALGRTHFIGVAGLGTGDSEDHARWQGVYTNRSRTGLGQVAAWDGTSNTLMYGECVGTRSRSGGGAFRMEISWVGGGALGTDNGLNRGQDGFADTFASVHRRGVHFAFADGAVRTLRHGLYRDDRMGTNFMAWHLLQQLAGLRDGGVLDATELILD